MRCSHPREASRTAPHAREQPRRLGGVEEALIALADPGPDSRVLLIGPTPADLACALACRGISHVRVMRSDKRLRLGSADLVIVAGLIAPDFLARALANARSVLAPPGTVAIRLPTDLDDALVRRTARALAQTGFTRVRARPVGSETLLRAEAPLFGRSECA